jgi:uncharacterized LabA/DUF88 family protein
MMDKGQILIDGSYLFACIASLKRQNKIPDEKVVSVEHLTRYLMVKWRRFAGDIIRVNYYFKKQDKRISNDLHNIEIERPDLKDHWAIIECGEPISSMPEGELNKIDLKYRDQCRRAEKGLDMRIACDALSAAATGRIQNFVFMINDRDYIPLLDALQRMGCRTYITSFGADPPNKELLRFCDCYNFVDPNCSSILENRPA